MMESNPNSNSSSTSEEYPTLKEEDAKGACHQVHDSTRKKVHEIFDNSQLQASHASPTEERCASKIFTSTDMDLGKGTQVKQSFFESHPSTVMPLFPGKDYSDNGRRRSDSKDWRSGPTTKRPWNDHRDFVKRPYGDNTNRTEVSRSPWNVRKDFSKRPIGDNTSRNEITRRPWNDGRGIVGNPKSRFQSQSTDLNLKRLHSLKDNDLLIGVFDARSRFFQILQKHVSNTDEYHTNQIPTIFEILARISKCTHSNAISNRFLIDVLNTPSFTWRLQRLVTTEIIEMVKNGIFQIMIIQKLLQDMAVTMTSMLVRSENQAYHRLHLIVGGMDSLTQNLKSISGIGASIVNEETVTLISEMLLVDSAITTKYASLNESSSELVVKPPDDFRDYAIIPMNNELDGNDDAVFLRKNRVCGKYLSVDDYLDVQFRLMREDFIAPLRKGINEYRDQELMFATERKKITEVRIYEKTRIYKEHWLHSGVGFVIQLDKGFLAKKLNWETSKRLIYGSLLAFWDKKFNRIFLAVIEDRQAPVLSRLGQFVARFLNEDITNDHLQLSYVMFESSAFFEAYRHVLLRLKTITSNEMPFKEHLVDCDQKVLSPAYLNNNEELRFNFRCISIDGTSRPSKSTLFLEDTKTSGSENELSDDDDGLSKMEGFEKLLLRTVPSPNEISDDLTVPLDIDDWPTAEDLGLDDSQYAALQNAVTKRLSVIQGPPGTGKTYIGLKIAHLLLKNVVEPSNGAFGPILLVCYTNHALDQFLEGIVDFKKHKIVRIGIRCKSEKLEEFKLSNVRREYFIRHFALEEDSYQFDHEMQFLKDESVFLNRLFEATTESFMKMNKLEEFISQEHHIAITADATSLKEEEEQLLAWLLNDAFESIDNSTPEAITEVVNEITTQLTDEEIRNIANSYVNSEKDKEAKVTIFDVIDFETSQRQLDEEENAKDVRDESPFAKELAEKVIKEEFTPLREVLAVSNENMVNYISSELIKRDHMNEEKEAEVLNPWYLSQPDKWRLYRLWRQRYQLKIQREHKYVSDRYDQLCKEYTQLRTHSDLAVIRGQDLIAMTTTGAARYGEVLSVIKPRIVIVEEAAEVFESHIISSLSSGCEHLILIGDHKQLRPSPAVYQLAKSYNLDVSLFERLIRNDFPYNCLAIQHRMRPEISRLLRQGGIYPELEDHSSVDDYPVIKGVSSNVFFLNHQHLENQDQDSTSHSNTFEAEFAVRLCRHFILQGYKPSKITILTLYSGQLFLIKRFIEGTIYNGLTVTVVDNYQGEENDIIILSLVRSNMENIIGFVGIENRICVALSRARMGLFVLGNFDLMKRKSTLWSTIIKLVEKENQIGDGIQLACQLHKEDESLTVKCASDFDKFSPNGGCDKTCSKRLKCGHICVKPCHIEDQAHALHQCRQICSQLCDRGLHEYKFYCFERRLPCYVKIDQEISLCGHTIRVPCHVTHLLCSTLIQKTLDCGHVVEVLCWEKEKYTKCSFKCDKILKCGHVCSELCHHGLDQDHNRYYCKEICTKLCKRGLHSRKLQCHEHDVRACTAIIEQKVPSCGHVVKSHCHYQQSLLKCTFRCTEKLSCGHQCREKCGEPHSSICNEMVEKELNICKHSTMQRCSSTTYRDTKCFKRCEKTLSCGHKCRGLCQDCNEDILHLPCMYPCHRTLICGHKCNRPCTRYCPPCKKPCINQCEHFKCKKACNVSCFKCKEPCPNQCEHGRCTRRCSDICDHEPCSRPCQKKVFCGRCKTKVQCLSLCGEKCIRFCRNCDKSIFKKKFFGEEDKPDALFIMLRTCGHIFEINGLDRWIKSKDDHGVIKAMVCPRCTVPITMSSCRRYLDFCRRHLAVVERVNRQVQRLSTTLNSDIIRFQMKFRSFRNLEPVFSSRVQRCRSKTDLILSQNTFYIAVEVENLEKRVSEMENSTKLHVFEKSKIERVDGFIEHIKANLARIQLCLRRYSITEEALVQCRAEVCHVHDMVNIIKLYLKALKSTEELDSLETLWFRCSSTKIYNNDISKEIINELAQMDNDHFKSDLKISTMKPIEFLPSFGLSEGNWYKCSNGHIFPITAETLTLDGRSVCDKCKSSKR